MKKIIIRRLFKSGKFKWAYVRLARPTAAQWAEYLKLHGEYAKIGVGCQINIDATIINPYLVSLGDYVTLSSCHLIPHDGSIRQIFHATGKRVDAVGKIEIRDNSFVGYNATVLRNVTIGPNSIVAAGAVVSNNVPERTVVGGVPAKKICTIDELAERLDRETCELPWKQIVHDRDSAFDPAVEPKLRKLRSEFFWVNARRK